MAHPAKLHSLNNITHLYRARRFWHTPQLDEAIAKIINHFGDRRDIPHEFKRQFCDGLRRHALPSTEGWNVFYEPCPIIKTTALEIVVHSRLFPPDVPFRCDGGKFHVNKAKLQKDGRAYHSRHGEYFYLAIPKEAIALAAKEIQPCVQ